MRATSGPWQTMLVPPPEPKSQAQALPLALPWHHLGSFHPLAGLEADEDLFEYLELKRKEVRMLGCSVMPTMPRGFKVAAMTQAAEIAREQADSSLVNFGLRTLGAKWPLLV